MDLSVLYKSPIYLFSTGTVHHSHTEFLALHNSCKQPKFNIRGNLFPSGNFPHSLTVSAVSHPSHVFTLSPIYVNSITVDTSLHNSSSCLTACMQYFHHISCRQDILKSLELPSWSYPLHSSTSYCKSTYHILRTEQNAPLLPSCRSNIA